MTGPAALLIAATLVWSCLFSSGQAEPEHDPATRAADMAEAATGSRVSEEAAEGAQIPAETPKNPHVTFYTPLPEEYAAYVVEVCEGYGLDPAVVFGVMQQESAYQADAIGDGGKAVGIMQVQPRWHADRMARLGVTDLTDPRQAVLVGCDYLAELLETYGDYPRALTCYRYGCLTVSGEDYSGIVLANAAAIRGE